MYELDIMRQATSHVLSQHIAWRTSRAEPDDSVQRNEAMSLRGKAHPLAARRTLIECEQPAPEKQVITHTHETIHLHVRDNRQCAQHMQRVCTVTE